MKQKLETRVEVDPGTTFESVEALDEKLSRAARSAGGLRLGLGEQLERLARMSGHHELGFSSIEAYALERCERSARWVQASRALARRLQGLPAVRRALATNRISFCMAQVIATVANAEDEDVWLADAENRTVRQMRALVREREAASAESVVAAASASTEEERGTLTVTVDREEVWLFECARTLVRHVGGATLEETLEALVGEGTIALLPEVPRGRVPELGQEPSDAAQRFWEAQLAAWRDEAEARCESRVVAHARQNTRAEARDGEHVEQRREEGLEGTRRASAPGEQQLERAERKREEPSGFDAAHDPVALDADLRRLAAELARKDLSIGRLAEAFWKADGWRRIGYATESQYARERLGCSLSSMKAKRGLARRVDKLPRLALAIEARELGYEAARLVAVVAVPETEEAWVARARERTVRHLREEVDAVQMLGRLSGRRAMLPPSDGTMNRIATVESTIVSGRAFRDPSPGPPPNPGPNSDHTSANLAALGEPHGGPGQLFAELAELADLTVAAATATQDRRAAAQGRVTLRFRAGVGLIRYYRSLEAAFRRHRPEPVSFFRFLCVALIDSWRHTLGTSVEYGRIYERDRFRCTSPVCTRRDVTPHHLTFRSHGGDDSDDNVASLCLWCHLEGVHGGRLTARPPASEVEWTLGRSAHTIVRGRARGAGQVRARSHTATHTSS